MAYESLRAAFEIHLITHGKISAKDAFFADDGFLYRLLGLHERNDGGTALHFGDVGTQKLITIVDYPDFGD